MPHVLLEATLTKLVALDKELKYGSTERKFVTDFRDKVLDAKVKYYNTLNATYLTVKEQERQKARKAREKQQAAAAAAAAKAKELQDKLEAGETVEAAAGPSGVKKPSKPRKPKSSGKAPLANVDSAASTANAATEKALEAFLAKKIKVYMEANPDADEDDVEIEQLRLETKEFPAWYAMVTAKAAEALDL